MNPAFKPIRRLLLRTLVLWLPAVAMATGVTITYANYKPYSFEVDGKAIGLEVDLLNEALGKRMGLTLTHRILPWERAQQLVRAGEADAFVATSTQERATYADASREAVTFWEIALYFRKGDSRFTNLTTLAALAPFNIGSLNGNGWVKTNLPGMNIQYVNKMELLPKMLVLGRIDVIPDNPFVMHDLLAGSDSIEQIEESRISFAREGMHLQVGKTSALRARLAEFDTVLRKMKEDGSWQRIHRQYKEGKP